MLIHRRVTPSIKFAGIHLYTWVERGTVRVKCLAQKHNTMSPARARTRTARSGVERTNHEATTPPSGSSLQKTHSKKSLNYLYHNMKDTQVFGTVSAIIDQIFLGKSFKKIFYSQLTQTVRHKT